jgi:hypothetical protein
MPGQTSMICAYGGTQITCHWHFAPTIPPEHVQSWLGQILAEFNYRGLFECLWHVVIWSPEHPSAPAVFKQDKAWSAFYVPAEKTIHLNDSLAGKGDLTHEFWHHVASQCGAWPDSGWRTGEAHVAIYQAMRPQIANVVEGMATDFADTIGLGRAETAPGLTKLFHAIAIARGF